MARRERERESILAFPCLLYRPCCVVVGSLWCNHHHHHHHKTRDYAREFVCTFERDRDRQTEGERESAKDGRLGYGSDLCQVSVVVWLVVSRLRQSQTLQGQRQDHPRAIAFHLDRPLKPLNHSLLSIPLVDSCASTSRHTSH